MTSTGSFGNSEHSPSPQPIDSPAAWYAADLETSESWRFEFDAEAIEELTTANRLLRTKEIDIESIDPSEFDMPNVERCLQQVRHELDAGRGLAIVRRVPDKLLEDGNPEALFWLLGQLIGTPLSQTADGAKMFHVRDERLAENDPRARGPSSNKQLSFHSDRCDVIGFLCLQRAKSGGDNDLVSSVTIHNEILQRRPELVQTLFDSYLYERHNVDSGNELPIYEQPIFSMCDGQFSSFLMRVLIERAYRREDTPEMSSLQRDALDLIAEIAEEPAIRFRFTQHRGDIVFFNNLITLHRRTAFVDEEQLEKRRHLLRLWLAMPNSRPLSPAFAPTFGNVAAGSIRGGMRLKRSKSP